MNNNSFIYLSYFMDAFTPLYGGGEGISVKPDRSIDLGDTANTKNLAFQNHSGTHIDYPNHFFIDGITSEAYDASFWIFQKPFLICQDVEENEIIDICDEQLKEVPYDTDFLIFKTGFGKYRGEEKYWKYNPGFAPVLADKLRKKLPSLKVLGMDFISLTAYQNRELGREAHRCFLRNDQPILLIEDMNLLQLVTSPKSVSCLPLMIKGLDGAPVTIVAEI
jgi:arylformamidase